MYRLAELTGLTVATVRRAVQGARRAGLAHVAGHISMGTVGGIANLWAHGPGVDATYQPKPPDTLHNGDWSTADSAGRVLARLTCGACSAKVLAAEGHLSLSVCRRYLYQMHAAGRVRISDWLRADSVGGNYTKIWALGPGPDAERPKARSKSENYRAWRERKIKQYGPEVAKRMFISRHNGGADSIVIDGRVVYRRGPKITQRRDTHQEVAP